MNRKLNEHKYLIKVEPLKRVIEAVLLSPYVKGEKPISLLIVAKPESGKTSVMKMYRETKGTVWITDCTAHGITHEILPRIVQGEVKTLMIPDLTTPLSKPPRTRQAFVAFLNNLIEEGVAKITTAFTVWDREATANMITAITDREYNDGRHSWAKLGFLSRFVCFSYSYDDDTIADIMDAYSEHGLELENVKLKIPSRPKDITLSKDMADRLNPIAKRIGKQFQLYGIRAKVNLRSLLKALALRNGRDFVSEEDYKEFQELSDYFNFKYKEIEDMMHTCASFLPHRMASKKATKERAE